MVGMSTTIGHNVLCLLKQNNKKQNDLAMALGVSKQVMSNMLSGSRMVNAFELNKIASFFNVPMESLITSINGEENVDAVHVFMGEVKSKEARDSLKIVDELADMVLFYARLRDNAEKMNKAWDD